MELLRANLIVTGGFTIAENGLAETVSAGRAAGNAVSAGTAWTVANVASADPHDDERTGLEYMEDNYGLGVDDIEILTSRPTWNRYKIFDNVREVVDSFRVMSTVGEGHVAVVRAEQGLPDVRVFNKRVMDPNGTTTRLITDDYWVMVPKRGVGVLGETIWGVPQAANLSGLKLERDQRPGPIAYVNEESNPPALMTVVDAMGLPIMKAPNWTYSINTNAGL